MIRVWMLIEVCIILIGLKLVPNNSYDIWGRNTLHN